jgi:signal transduction histidine kinase
MPNPDSEHPIDEAATAYETTLRAYLSGNAEEGLRQAYELGRAAILRNLGVLDVVELHYQALKAMLPEAPSAEITQQIRAAMIFLEESLSPFEITHRGYRDAVELVRHVTSFTSIACHEVKAPLTSILASAGMLQEILQADQNSSENKLLMNVLSGAAILKARTDDMMDIAGLYSGSLSIRVEPVHIVDFLRRVRDHLEPEVLRRGMKLNLDVSKKIPVVEIDPDRIEQVITNLVQNACKYAAEGGRVDLSATIGGTHVIIGVRDYGGGLPHFRPPDRAITDAPTRSDSQAHGTGLGLILCRQLAEAHRGKSVVSSEPGTGSIFQLWLPRKHTNRVTGGRF